MPTISNTRRKVATKTAATSTAVTVSAPTSADATEPDQDSDPIDNALDPEVEEEFDEAEDQAASSPIEVGMPDGVTTAATAIDGVIQAADSGSTSKPTKGKGRGKAKGKKPSGSTTLKATVSQASLLELLLSATTAEKHDVLRYIKLFSKAGHLYAQSFDLKTQVVSKVIATVEAEGWVLVSPKELKTIAFKLGGKAITLEATSAQLTLMTDVGNFTTSCVLHDFPALEYGDEEEDSDVVAVSISAAALSKGLIGVSPCIHLEETSPYNGVRLEVNSKSKGFRLTATDETRVAVFNADTEEKKGKFEFQGTLPASSVKALSNLLKKENDSKTAQVSVEYAKNGNSIKFTANGTSLTCLLLAGEFPGLITSLVSPQVENPVCRISQAGFAECLSRHVGIAQLGRSKKKTGSEIKLQITSDTLYTTCQSKDGLHSWAERTDCVFDSESEYAGLFTPEFLEQAVSSQWGDVELEINSKGLIVTGSNTQLRVLIAARAEVQG